MFGFWDFVAPLVGLLLGAYLAAKIASTPEYIGAIVLGAYGLYLVVQARRTPTPDQLDQRWILFGLPLPLSIDNVVAGTSLGLLGFSPWLAPPVFGTITAVVSFIGLQLGRAAAGLIRVRADLLTGVALIVMALALGLGLGDV